MREPPDEARVFLHMEALTEISHKQGDALRMIMDNGFVFDEIGSEPGNWQHLAFSLYNQLCEIDLIARSALYDGFPGNTDAIP